METEICNPTFISKDYIYKATRLRSPNKESSSNALVALTEVKNRGIYAWKAVVKSRTVGLYICVTIALIHKEGWGGAVLLLGFLLNGKVG